MRRETKSTWPVKILKLLKNSIPISPECCWILTSWSSKTITHKTLNKSNFFKNHLKLLFNGRDKDNWIKIAKKIMSACWKIKGSYIFHQPVDPIKLGIEDYFDIVKQPMDFGTIKVCF